MQKSLKKQIGVIAETKLAESQNGFRKGSCCSDCIFVLTQIIEEHREFNIPTYIAFVDFEKTFDMIDREELFKIITEGYPEHLMRMVQSMYNNTLY